MNEDEDQVYRQELVDQMTELGKSLFADHRAEQLAALKTKQPEPPQQEPSPEELEYQRIWEIFEHQHGALYTQTLQEHHAVQHQAHNMEPGTPDTTVGQSLIRISQQPRHPRYGEPAPEAPLLRGKYETNEQYVEASEAWIKNYQDWQDAQKSTAYVVYTPWKCPSPPEPLYATLLEGTPEARLASNVHFHGSRVGGYHIDSQDGKGLTAIYLTDWDVPIEAKPYIQGLVKQWEDTDPNSFKDTFTYTNYAVGEDGEPIPETRYRTADQLKAEHEFLGLILKNLLSFVSVRTHQSEAPTPPTKPYTAKVHRISFTADLGIQNAIRATGDPLRFIPNPSHGTAEARDNPKSPVSFVIDATRNAEIWTTISNSDDDRIAYINEAVAQQTGLLSRDSGITNAYMLGRLLQSDGQVEIGIGELQKVRGKTKRTPEEKEQLTYEIKQAFELWGTAKLRGSREWRQDKGKKELVEFEDSFWHCTPVYPNGQGPLTGFYGPPCGFILVDSTVTRLYRRHPTMLHAIGSLDPFLVLLAESGKVAADWAVSMGWASLHYGRTNAQTSGDKIKLKRRTLLTAYKPHTSVQSLIDAGRLSRMTTYWTEAIKKLKRLKIWESIEEPPKPADPQGWAEEWLDQTVIITLGGDYQQHTQAVQRARKTGLDEIKKRTSKKPKKP